MSDSGRCPIWIGPLAVPAALAAGEATGITGAEFLASVAAGYECAARILHSMDMSEERFLEVNGETLSLFAAAGRYILDRAIFDALRRVKRGAGGEIQLTDAIALLIAEGHPVHVVVHRGTRHDLGNPGGYLKAAVDFALDRDDYGPDLRRWLVERLGLAER